jgi:hypothetical protein
MLDGENISELAFCFFASIFATPALADKFIDLRFDVKA